MSQAGGAVMDDVGMGEKSGRMQVAAPLARSVRVVGAPSNIGIKPYDDGTPRRLDLAPAVLRQQGLIERIDGRDLGDVSPPAYRDFVRQGTTPRNEREVVDYSHLLAAAVEDATRGDNFVLLLGGDCSVVLGSLLGAKRSRE